MEAGEGARTLKAQLAEALEARSVALAQAKKAEEEGSGAVEAARVKAGAAVEAAEAARAGVEQQLRGVYGVLAQLGLSPQVSRVPYVPYQRVVVQMLARRGVACVPSPMLYVLTRSTRSPATRWLEDITICIQIVACTDMCCVMVRVGSNAAGAGGALSGRQPCGQRSSCSPPPRQRPRIQPVRRSRALRPCCSGAAAFPKPAIPAGAAAAAAGARAAPRYARGAEGPVDSSAWRRRCRHRANSHCRGAGRGRCPAPAGGAGSSSRADGRGRAAAAPAAVGARRRCQVPAKDAGCGGRGAGDAA